jgi:adenine/guanine/hypoxanthine permease
MSGRNTAAGESVTVVLGLYGGGFVKVPVDIGQTITAPPAVPLALGDFNTLPFLMAVIALALTVLFMARRINGGLLLGIVLATAIAITIHYITGRQTSAVPGKAVLPERWFATPDFSTFGQGLNFGVFAKLGFISAVLSVFSLMLSDFFDTLGTVIGIGAQGGWLTREGKLPRMFAVLTVDSLGAVFGGIAGSSSSTTFVESAGGVAEGGRTGLTSVVVGILFLMALFVAPVAAIVPPEATASALIVVGFLMCGVIREINFSDFSEGFPALITMVVMPLTYSISNGIGAGFLSYAFIKVVTGNGRAVRWPMWIVCLGFVVYFARPWIKSAFGV